MFIITYLHLEIINCNICTENLYRLVKSNTNYNSNLVSNYKCKKLVISQFQKSFNLKENKNHYFIIILRLKVVKAQMVYKW